MSCCPTSVLPVESDYQSKSSKIYVAGQGNTKGLLFVPDIFGPHPNAHYVCDILAARGFLVLMPDFFPGNSHWDVNDFPPKDGGFASPAFGAFLGSLTYDENLKPTVEQGIAMLKALGATSIGSVGFCWGGNITFHALADGLVQAGASPHPSMLTPELMARAQGPVCLLPSKEDGEMMELKDAAETSKHSVTYQYFNDMHHGFCAARADFKDENNRKRANEAIDIMVKFFNESL